MKSLAILAAAAGLAATAAPASAQYTSAYVTTPVYMRSGPDTAYPAMAVIPAGVPLTVYGCLNGWLWCDVSWGPNRGWVAGRFLAAQWQNQPVPFYSAAPHYNVPVISFFFGNYWDTHYRYRPVYRYRDHWSRWDHGGRRWR